VTTLPGLARVPVVEARVSVVAGEVWGDVVELDEMTTAAPLAIYTLAA